MLRNVMWHARGLLGAAGGVWFSRHVLGGPHAAEMDGALRSYASLVVIALSTWAVLNLGCAVREIPGRLEARRDRRNAERLREMALAYPPPLAVGMDEDERLYTAMIRAAMIQAAVSMSAVRNGKSVLLPPAAGLHYVKTSEIWRDGVLTEQAWELHDGRPLSGLSFPGGGGRPARQMEFSGQVYSNALCGKCGFLMRAHAYYGAGPCLIRSV
jgi:hypothetical protein